MTKKWSAFPHADDAYDYSGPALKKNWERLHRGDQEPFPKAAPAQDAWRAFHAGDFQAAVEAGTNAGPAGMNAANKAQIIYANYLEKTDTGKLKLLQETVERAAKQRDAMPQDANAHYLYAFALGRYSQRISISQALKQGYGGKIKDALTTALELAPNHAEAHITYGTYQAEIIDKVGALLGGVTYGASKDSAIEHFRKATALFPESAIARIEHANGLIMMFGKSKIDEATKLYEQAAGCDPKDAMERLDVEHAREELA